MRDEREAVRGRATSPCAALLGAESMLEGRERAAASNGIVVSRYDAPPEPNEVHVSSSCRCAGTLPSTLKRSRAEEAPALRPNARSKGSPEEDDDGGVGRPSPARSARDAGPSLEGQATSGDEVRRADGELDDEAGRAAADAWARCDMSGSTSESGAVEVDARRASLPGLGTRRPTLWTRVRRAAWRTAPSSSMLLALVLQASSLAASAR